MQTASDQIPKHPTPREVGGGHTGGGSTMGRGLGGGPPKPHRCTANRGAFNRPRPKRPGGPPPPPDFEKKPDPPRPGPGVEGRLVGEKGDGSGLGVPVWWCREPPTLCCRRAMLTRWSPVEGDEKRADGGWGAVRGEWLRDGLPSPPWAPIEFSEPNDTEGGSWN